MVSCNILFLSISIKKHQNFIAATGRRRSSFSVSWGSYLILHRYVSLKSHHRRYKMSRRAFRATLIPLLHTLLALEQQRAPSSPQLQCWNHTEILFFWQFKSASSNNVEAAGQEWWIKSVRYLEHLFTTCSTGRQSRGVRRRELPDSYNTFCFLTVIQKTL